MKMNEYQYDELKTKALSPKATDADLAALGEWFLRYGNSYWNGEEYTVDSNNRLRPVYEETEPDEWEIKGWELR